MKYLFAIILLGSIILSSCGEEVKNQIEKPKVGEITELDEPFKNPSLRTSEKSLLKELGICGDAKDTMCTPCNSGNFTLTKYRSDRELKDAFILQIKAGTKLKGESTFFSERRILIFERENGKLVRTNGFVGELRGFEETGKPIQNLIVTFYLPKPEYDMVFHCLFNWEKGMYKFKEVIEFDTGSGPIQVNPKDKKERSEEIFGALNAGKLIF